MMIRTLLVLGMVGFVGGCSSDNFKEKIGLGRYSPDEFMIITNEPLQVPKNYAALPKPGEIVKVASNRISPQQQAKMAFGEKMTGSTKAVKQTSGDKAFLAKVKAGDKDIAQKINADNKKIRTNFITGTITVSVVNSTKEADRINEASEKGEVIIGSAETAFKVREKVE